jgi:hypothetical protein
MGASKIRKVFKERKLVKEKRKKNKKTGFPSAIFYAIG